ncbi:MAG: DUF5677 domain-containing protein [Bacilli bacterium]|nr:DUF5677 domain-containing protein [Bacilli bacterium]
MINLIKKEQFIELIKHFNLQVEVNYDFLYDVYETSVSGIKDLNETNVIGHINGINQYDLINYCLGEYLYLAGPLNKEDLETFTNNENNVAYVASVVADKYLTLSIFNYQEKKVMNKYLPPVSTLNLYLNFILNILNNYPSNEPNKTLVRDLLARSASIARCILSLLVDGYTTEAYATWRTLHECECTLTLLERYGEPLISKYLRHMDYGIAYKNGIKDKVKTDAIFNEIKTNMAEHDLKSKDMKKYIEYGWLYGIKEFNDDPSYKLNFKDGLERISGIKGYGEAYNLSSEIVHATPMLIYPNKDYFYFVTLLSLYEAFFRLESSFVTLFTKHIDKPTLQSYIRMRNMYYNHLKNIYRREKERFIRK